ncbi:MAG: PilN domain-containing protein [Deltaproteobacteria bacterium]|nr:PilN domain-containing protein [Deltaproteobacteria bacterium]
MIRVNLLPVRAARRKENIRRQVSIFALCIVFTVSAMAYLAVSMTGTISDLTAKIEAAQRDLKRYQTAANRREKTDIIAKLEENRTGPVQIMDALTSLVVAERMWLTSLTEAGGKMNLAGVAMDNKTIADFMTRLENSPYFKVVDLISSKQIKLQKDKKFKQFTMTCQLSSRGPKKEPET